MSEEPKKKLVFKKKGGSSTVIKKKPVIKLNPHPDEAKAAGPDSPATEVIPKETADTANPESQAASKPQPEPEAPPVEKKKEEPKKAEDAPFKFYCVYCGQKLSANPAMSGKSISCPACNHKIVVPDAP